MRQPARATRRLFQLLLDHGASRKDRPPGPVLVGGCTACFDLLLPLAQPADLTSGLQGAVRMGDLPRIQALLDRGARPGGNLLQIAAVSPAHIPLETIRSLISAGADVNAKTSTGLSVLDFAKRQGNAALVEALTQAGVAGESPRPAQPAAQAGRIGAGRDGEGSSAAAAVRRSVPGKRPAASRATTTR